MSSIPGTPVWTPTTTMASPYVPYHPPDPNSMAPAGAIGPVSGQIQHSGPVVEATSALRNLISKPPTEAPQEFVVMNGVKYVREGAADTETMAQLTTGVGNLAVTSQQPSKTHTNELSSRPVKVTFDTSPEFIYVQKDILRQFLGHGSALARTLEDVQEVTLEDVSPSAVSTLIRCFYATNPEFALDLQGKSLAEVLDIYVVASKYGSHDALRTTCHTKIINDRYIVDDLLASFRVFYQTGFADQEARDTFQSALRVIAPSVQPGYLATEFASAARAGGDFAEDVTKVMLQISDDDRIVSTDEPIGPGPAVRGTDWDFADDHGVSHHSVRNVDSQDWFSGVDDGRRVPCVDGTRTGQSGFIPRAFPRSGWAETAPPSEADVIETIHPTTVHWASGFDDTDWGYNNNLAGDNEDNTSGGSPRSPTQLKFGPATGWQHPNDIWHHTGPTAEGLARARAASAAANDAWSMNVPTRDDSWDAPASIADQQDWQAVHVPQLEQLPPHAVTSVPALRASAGAGSRLSPLSNAVHATQPTREALQNPENRAAPSPGHGTLPPAPNNIIDPLAAAQASQREMNHPPFPMAPPSVFPHPGDGPIGMPNYLPYFGYNRVVSMGNEMFYPTQPGLYGLAGRTMVAATDSGWDCSLYFKAGDVITNVIPLYQPSYSVLPFAPPPNISNSDGTITHLQGICRGRAGHFPTQYVREMNPPVFRNLGTPFDPIPTPIKPKTQAATQYKTTQTANDIDPAATVKPTSQPQATCLAKFAGLGGSCGNVACKDCCKDQTQPQVIIGGAGGRHDIGIKDDGAHNQWVARGTWGDDADDGNNGDWQGQAGDDGWGNDGVSEDAQW